MSNRNLRNTLVKINYGNIKAVLHGIEGRVESGSYRCDSVGRSQYVPEEKQRVVFVSKNGSTSVEPHKVQLKVNNQVIDLSSLKDDEDAWSKVHKLLEQAKQAK